MEVHEEVQMGIITRIAMKNFVTYDEVVVKPGKNLNLIIGPNGTGKSTIVSAIVLGLGGSPSVIGRAPQIGHYVKSGEQNATIEIDLQNGPNKFVTVTRMFNLQNHTTWMVNKKSATSKQITDLMRTFNIQVDNLCQFLPQDKVVEFANMSPPKLLEETERSVGDPKLLDNHLKLKALRTQQADLEEDLEKKTRLQDREKQIYDSLKDSVGHIQEQNAIKKKLKTLKQKKNWLIFQNKREEFNKAKIGRDEAQNKKNDIAKKLQPVEAAIAKLKSSIQGLEKTAKQHNSEISAKTAKLHKFLDDIEKQEKCIDEIEALCEQKIREEQESDNCIDELREQTNKMENDFRALVAKVGEVGSLQEQLNSNTPQMNQHRVTANELSSQRNFFKEQIDHNSRKIRGEEQVLQQTQDIANKRFELLHTMSADAYKGVLWLRENSHLFSKTIHEPMLLHINLKDSKYAKYFENIIPQRDLTAFVCEDKNDMNLLLRYLRDQQKLRINAVHSDPNRVVNYEPSIPLQNIQQYGFEHYLVSLIDAPQTILSYLVKMYGLNEIPIGNDKVQSSLDHIPDRFRRFFSSNNSYSVSRSKYTGEKSTRQSAIYAGKILSITVDTDKIRKIQEEITLSKEKLNALNDELKTIDEKIVKVQEKIKVLKEIRSRIQGSLDQIQNLQVRINVNEKKIQGMQSNRMSIDQIRSKYKQEIQAAVLKQLQHYRQYNKLLDDLYKNIIINEEFKLQIKMEKNKLANKENDSHDLREEFNNAERDYENLNRELQPLKAELKSAYDTAKESTGGLEPEDKDFAPLMKSFAKLPATIEKLFEEIQATQARIFCLTNDQQEAKRVLDQFNIAKRHLEELDVLIKQRDEELSKVTQQIEKVKGEWLPMLESLVEKINANFSHSFTRMKCAGEVSLIKGDNEMDFDKYGLRIKVKFRDADELQALTRTHQSGGERAVTTAVYMIALQELTRVPFRCVDEINQGMDATNERRIFELIVKITSQCSSSQYFMLTPKLLPGLKYNDSVTVLTVFNAKFMVPCSEFDIHDQCDNIVQAVRRRRLAAH
ncbi:hypothetical protein TSAR_002632 [Trichomalopsis sarcophagae]|uniref:Structural maintenance of chromosomes protein 5 n=1 Tax=Trichomalopsis sarcophagae TaxID=543379 RepID=A0A232FBU9_9HYME|nr:hypothetical protein TSAR_002632 [Trichomalopsis sarcophagae]